MLKMTSIVGYIAIQDLTKMSDIIRSRTYEAFFPLPSAVRFHDVDNRLKDVMDALQGRAGGPKSRRPLPPIVPNDRQVRRVVVEKMVAPKQSGGSGHLTIRACRARPTAR